MARDFHLPGRSPVYATNGMAATSMPAATLTALDVLRAGGNALDAAVAAVAVLGVIEPQGTGIGGDCFCLYAPAGGPIVALNGSGAAPAAAEVGWFEGQGITALDPSSPHTVTVPGAVSAWETLLEAHGTRGLDELLQRLLPTGRLRFTTDLGEVADAAVQFICVGTPQLEGENAADTSFVYAAAEAMAPHLRDGALVVGKSTVPVGTAKKLRKKLANASNGKNYIETVWGRGYVLREPVDDEARIPA